jgi:hypothetical protein
MLASVPGSGKKRVSEEAPYARYAFFNPYNLSLLAGAATTAAATGHWWIALCAAASEAVWMLFAPDSKVLRRLWFDERWEQSKKFAVEDRREHKFQQLTPADQQRAFNLREQRTRIYQLAKDNPSLTVELLEPEMAKLDNLYEDFLDLALVCGRSERHLGSFDTATMERTWKYYEKQTKDFKDGDQRHKVAAKNLEVIGQRMQRLEQVRKNLQTARGQMDLMENSFRLLADEIITVADPAELGVRLDDLRIGVQAIRETSQDENDLYVELEELEEEPAAQKQQRR